MKKEYFSYIRNPMTIIALFVGLTEIGFTIALPKLSDDLQATFLWFVILFPVVCGIGFF